MSLRKGDAVFSRDAVIEQETKKFPEKVGQSNKQKSDRTRTIRKNVNDIFFNFLANICVGLYASIEKRYAKKSQQKKDRRIKFKSFTYSGVVLIPEQRIIDLGNHWLIGVLNKLEKEQKDFYYLSLKTISDEVMYMNYLLSHEGEEVKESIENYQQEIQNENNDFEQTTSVDTKFMIF